MQKPNANQTRMPHKAIKDSELLWQFLAENRVGNLAFAGEDSIPYQIPIAYAAIDRAIYLHGSTAAGGLRAVADGRLVSFGVFRNHGLVLARSAFESSMNYASALLFGNCTAISDVAEKDRILLAVTESLFPGRSAELRQSTKKELAATLVLKLEVSDWSYKISDGGPDDPESDLAEAVWAGVIPIVSEFREPIPAADLKPEFHELPAYLKTWKA